MTKLSAQARATGGLSWHGYLSHQEFLTEEKNHKAKTAEDLQQLAKSSRQNSLFRPRAFIKDQEMNKKGTGISGTSNSVKPDLATTFSIIKAGSIKIIQ